MRQSTSLVCASTSCRGSKAVKVQWSAVFDSVHSLNYAMKPGLPYALSS